MRSGPWPRSPAITRAPGRRDARLAARVQDGLTLARQSAEKAGGTAMNHLYYGDNLQVLRESIADESVDLIYLDPPFNSNASYSHLFKDESGQVSGAQIAAFDDTWHWDDMVSGQALIELRDSRY